MLILVIKEYNFTTILLLNRKGERVYAKNSLLWIAFFHFQCQCQTPVQNFWVENTTTTQAYVHKFKISKTKAAAHFTTPKLQDSTAQGHFQRKGRLTSIHVSATCEIISKDWEKDFIDSVSFCNLQNWVKSAEEQLFKEHKHQRSKWQTLFQRPQEWISYPSTAYQQKPAASPESTTRKKSIIYKSTYISVRMYSIVTFHTLSRMQYSSRKGTRRISFAICMAICKAFILSWRWQTESWLMANCGSRFFSWINCTPFLKFQASDQVVLLALTNHWFHEEKVESHASFTTWQLIAVPLFNSLHSLFCSLPDLQLQPSCLSFHVFFQIGHQSLPRITKENTRLSSNTLKQWFAFIYTLMNKTCVFPLCENQQCQQLYFGLFWIQCSFHLMDVFQLGKIFRSLGQSFIHRLLNFANVNWLKYRSHYQTGF